MKVLTKDDDYFDFSKKKSTTKNFCETLLALVFIIIGSIWIMLKICPNVLAHFSEDGVTVYGEIVEFF
jgi:hypothetical protein